MNIKIKKLRNNFRPPAYSTSGSAGADLFACLDEPVLIKPMERVKIPLGFAAEIPAGYGGFIFIRSSMGANYGISMANGVGIVDSDYRGEWIASLINNSDKDYIINDGDRIAQLVVLKTETAVFELSDELGSTERGEGGFGSTGR